MKKENKSKYPLLALRVPPKLIKRLKQEAKKREISQSKLMKIAICKEIGIEYVPEHYNYI